MLCMASKDEGGKTWVCLSMAHEADPDKHYFTMVSKSLPEPPPEPVRIVPLQCKAPDCGVQRDYKLTALHVRLYSHGVCSLAFFCLSCKEMTEFVVPDSVAIELDKAGAPTTIVHTPDEVLEWPLAEVPPIHEADVGLFERSSLRHLDECFQRELGSIDFGG